MGRCAEQIECDLTLLAATGIEDKLQDEVPETIQLLKRGGIKVWVLTGDKMETAVNIGYSCSLLSPQCQLVYLTGESCEDIKNCLVEHLSLIQAQQPCQSTELVEFGLIMDGRSLKNALHEHCIEEFLALALLCQVVVCCRSTPKNKSQIVEVIKKRTGAITLSIGDGANDVAMIQVGLSSLSLRSMASFLALGLKHGFSTM
jgi:phospholipid-transporting ATPase